MPAVFDQSRVTYQPQGQEGMQDLSSVFTQQGRELQAYGAQQLAQTSAHIDKAINTYNEFAVEKAQQDAPAIINRDGDGVLIPPSSFYPQGWNWLYGPAYAKTYRKASEAIYQQSAAADHENYSAAMKAKFPTDAAAYTDAMEKRRQQVVGNLAPDQAGYIDLRLKQIQGQGATQVGVALTAQNNSEIQKKAELELNGIVDTASRMDDVVLQQGEVDLGKVEQRIINHAVIGKRLEGVVAQLKSTGYSDSSIDRILKEAAFKIALGKSARTIRDTKFLDPDTKQPDGAMVADQQQAIWDYAARFPGREKQVTDFLNAELANATNQTSRVAQGIQLQQQKGVFLENRNNTLLERIAADPNTDADTAKAIRDSLNKRAMDHLSNPMLNDNIALQYARSAVSSGAVSGAAYAQQVSGKLTDLRSMATGPESTPQMVQQATTELQSILASPDLKSSLTPEQRYHAQSTIDQVAVKRIAGNLALAASDARAGTINAAQAETIFNEGIAKGHIGGPGSIMSIDTARAAIVAPAIAKDLERQTRETLAGEAMRSNRENRPLTPEQAKALEDTFPFQHGGAAGTNFNGADPKQVASATAYTDTHKIVPKAVKTWFETLPRREDPDAVAPYDTMLNGYLAVAQRMGLDGEAKWAQVTTWLGKTGVDFLRDASSTSLAAAAKAAAGGDGNSQTANQGAPTGKSDQDLAGSVDGFINNLAAARSNSGFMSKVLAGQNPLGSTEEERLADKLFGTSTGVDGGFDMPTTVTLSEAVRDRIVKTAAAEKMVDGKLHARIKSEGGNVNQFFLRRAYGVHADEFETVLKDPGDPSKGAVVQYKSFATKLAQGMNLPSFDPDAARGVGVGLLISLGKGPASPGTMPYDPKTVQFDPVHVMGEKPIWRVTVGTGDHVQHLTDIPQDHPKLRSDYLSLLRTASVEASQWWKPVAAKDKATMSLFAGLLVDAVTNPRQAAIAHDKVENLAKAAGKPTGGWQESWVNAVETVKDIWGFATGQDTVDPKDTEAFLKAQNAVLDLKGERAQQIRRFGLLHYMFRPTPNMGTLPPPGVELPGPQQPPPAQATHGYIAPGTGWQSYQAHTNQPFIGQDTIPPLGGDATPGPPPDLRSTGEQRSLGLKPGGQRFGGQRFGESR